MNSTLQEKLKIIIMAGGQGVRLWPKSSTIKPKQFNCINDNKTLLEKTLDRALVCAPRENIFISINQKHQKLFKKILPDFNNTNLIIEPETRDTTSAILFATLNNQFNPDDILCFLPSDSYIPNTSAFQKSIINATKLTSKTNQITLFGVKPTFPATTYGYLKTQKKISNKKKHLIIKQFIEKPDLEKAKELIKNKNNLWNSGIFLFHKNVILELATIHTPDHLAKIKQYYKIRKKQKKQANHLFKKLKKISFDYAIMEKVQNMNCLLANFFWNDIGSWLSFFSLFKKNSKGNILPSNVKAFATTDTCVELENKKLNLILNGIKDLIIVQSGNNIYITHKETEEQTKEIIKKLKIQ